MGFEVSVVVAIFFISAVILGTFSFTTLVSSSEIVNDASIHQHQMQNKKLQTDIVIDSLAISNITNPYDLTVTLTNTGSETLQFDELHILVDGELKPYNFSGNAAVWTPEETRALVVYSLTGLGSHRVKVVTENAISDYGLYSV
jgi:flagellar protein FlaF